MYSVSMQNNESCEDIVVVEERRENILRDQCVHPENHIAREIEDGEEMALNSREGRNLFPSLDRIHWHEED